MSKKISSMYTNEVLFGKYAGNTVANLLENDPEYLLFLARQNLITLSPSDKNTLCETLGFSPSTETKTIYNLGDIPF
jgi:hypothetical protein